jgi:nucleoside-diphosphate-sugar epimerase
MRILLTGANGNIGSNALRELLQRGHTVRCMVRDPRRLKVRGEQVEVVVGDVRNPTQVAAAVAGMDMVIHLAALIPPASDLKPALAHAINVDGTRNVIQAMEAQPQPPRLIYMSTIALFGATQDQPPPRRVGDPFNPLDPYSEHKIECEAMIHASTLTNVILRCTAVPRYDEGFDPVRIRTMFAINPDDRMEMLHPLDAGLALANAAESDAVWGKTLIIAGGPSCRMTMYDYYRGYFEALGVGDLPRSAFSHNSYHLDWYDTDETESLLHFQRHSFADFVQELARRRRLERWGATATRPLVRWILLRYAPVEVKPVAQKQGYFRLQ